MLEVLREENQKLMHELVERKLEVALLSESNVKVGSLLFAKNRSFYSNYPLQTTNQ